MATVDRIPAVLAVIAIFGNFLGWQCRGSSTERFMSVMDSETSSMVQFRVPGYVEIANVFGPRRDGRKMVLSIKMQANIPSSGADYFSIEVHFKGSGRLFGKAIVLAHGSTTYRTIPVLHRAAAVVDPQTGLQLAKASYQITGSEIRLYWSASESIGEPMLVVVRYLPHSMPPPRYSLQEAHVSGKALDPTLKDVSLVVPAVKGI